MVHYLSVNNEQDVQDILHLQAQNHKTAIDEATQLAQGFVTVQHDFNTLFEMNQAFPSTIARSGPDLAGYALMMPRTFRNKIPILAPMFQRLDQLSWNGEALDHQKWFVMGQVCVAEKFRGMGVFDGLYAQLKQQWAHQFDFVVTEISGQNPRSLRAHARVGFETLYRYNHPITGEAWQVVIWDWK